MARGFTIGGSRLVALEGLDLSVAEREIVAIVGPNGSGKSTLLRVIAGLLPPDDGTVAVDGRTVEGPSERVGLVFQEPRLLPWRDTLTNVAFPLELAGMPRSDRERRAREALDLVGSARVRGGIPGPAVGRDGAARGAGACAREPARACCCSTSRSARSMRSPGSGSTSSSRRSGRARR